MCKLIEGLRFAFEEAEDCDAALDLCRRNMPDAIFLDGHMPNTASIEFMRNVRSAPRGAKPIIVYITIENDISRITEAVNAGASDYIMKPFIARRSPRCSCTLGGSDGGAMKPADFQFFAQYLRPAAVPPIG